MALLLQVQNTDKELYFAQTCCVDLQGMSVDSSFCWVSWKFRPRQNGRLFADNTFKRIFVNENNKISIKILLKFVPKGLFNIPALVLIMAWRRPGDKTLSEPMMVRSLTHICVPRPQWVHSAHLNNVPTKRLKTAVHVAMINVTCHVNCQFNFVLIIKMYNKSDWSLFLRVQLIIFYNGFK